MGFEKLYCFWSALLLRKCTFFLSAAVSEHTVYYSYFLININLYLDQEVYDFIDPNTEDTAVPEQGDAHIGSFVSSHKVKKTLKQY